MKLDVLQPHVLQQGVNIEVNPVADNDEPDFITISIDGGNPVAMAPALGGCSDDTNGEVYEYTINGLAKDVSHTFQFAANDGTDDATGDTGVHDGPSTTLFNINPARYFFAC